jgi:hypothetical protein
MFGNTSKINFEKRPVRKVRPNVRYDFLEPRCLLASVNLIQSGPLAGTLLILGDAAADSVTITTQGTFVDALVNGVTHSGFQQTAVQKIQFNAGDNNDHFFNYTSIPSLVYGGLGSDTLIGGGSRDEFFGGADVDDLQGNGGFDQINGDYGNDWIKGGAGDDSLSGGFGDDIIWGEDQNDFLNGGKGDDRLYGGDGEDRLYGFEGKDFFDGGVDRDRIFSGGGRFNESRLDPNDFSDDSELIRGGAGQISKLKGNYSRFADSKVYVVAGNNATYPITIDDNTIIRMFNSVIPAGLLTRNHFLEVEYDYVTKVASTIRATPILIHEGNDVNNNVRTGAIVFSPGAMHDGGVVGQASGETDVDWYFFRSNVSGRIRMRVINPTLSGPPGANVEIQTQNGLVLESTHYLITNVVEVELNKGQLYWLKANGHYFQALNYQILFEPLEA